MKQKNLERNRLLDAIRQKCLDCSAYSYAEIDNCKIFSCPLYRFREGRNIKKIKGASTRALLNAIRRKCLDCCGGSREEVRECPVTACPLHPFRMGKVGLEHP